MPKRILYIEDNPNTQRLVKKVLEKHGYTLVMADDGESGIALAQGNTPPDLILVDVQMPGLDGLETARRLRQIAELSGTPVIALTAYLDRVKREQYLEAGFTDYQEKQAGIAPLLALVRRHLG